MNYWLVKQEPEKYSFDDLIQSGATDWTGVRNFQARNNLRQMRFKDRVLFYHSISEKAVVGMAEVSKEAFQDATDETEKWIAVEIKLVEKFARAVTLDEIKADADLQNIALIKQSRLSVMPLSKRIRVNSEIKNRLNLCRLKKSFGHGLKKIKSAFSTLNRSKRQFLICWTMS